MKEYTRLTKLKHNISELLVNEPIDKRISILTELILLELHSIPRVAQRPALDHIYELLNNYEMENPC